MEKVFWLQSLGVVVPGSAHLPLQGIIGESAFGLLEKQALCFVGLNFCSSAGNCLFSLALPKSPWQGD